MQTTQTAAEAVLNHHLKALMDNDLEEVMKDYAEESEVWTSTGMLIGIEAITSFFSDAFTIFPRGNTKFELKEVIVKDNRAYIVWNADSPVANVPFGTDSFEFDGDKIAWQTTSAQINVK